MANKGDFLSLLKKNKESGFEQARSNRLKYPDNLRVNVYAHEGETWVRLLGSDGKSRKAGDYYQVGKIGPLLRALNDIENRTRMSFDWGGISSGNTFSLEEYPFLTSYLSDCASLLVDSEMRPLLFVEDKTRVTFKLTTHTSGRKKETEMAGEFLIDGERVQAFLNPNLALTSSAVINIRNIGERFADLMAFQDPFEPEMLEVFLSIFFSTAENVKLDFDNRRVLFIDDPLPMTPVLAIVNIDSDNSLNLKVSETAGNIPMEIFENFKITHVAHVSDKDVTVRLLSESVADQSIETIRSSLESNAGKRAAREIWQEGNTFVVPPEIASKWLYNSFAELIHIFRIVGTDKLKKYKIVAAKPKLNMKLGSGIDFLEGNASVDLDGQKFTLRDLLAQYSKNKYVTLSDGNRAVLDPNYMRRLQRIFNNTPKGEEVKISFFDLPEVMDLLDEKEREQPALSNYRKFYEGFNKLSKGRVSAPGLKAKLRDYQKDGVKWINYLYDEKMGGCLADDMGLGKTVQTIAMLCRSVTETELPSLIVMPRSLLFNWQEEFKKFAPEIRVATYYGPSRDLKEAMKAQVILTSYAMVRNDIEELMKHTFDYIILDESQNIKNVDAMVTKSVWLLKGNHRLAISGTPIENNLTELYSLFHFLNPAMFGTLQNFNELYTIPIQREGDEDAANALRRKIFPFMLRRLKKDVLKDLPDRTEQVLMVDMSPRQAKLYEERRRYYAEEIGNTLSKGNSKAQFELLQALLELRQIASVPEEKSEGVISSPKIELLMDNLVQAVNGGHKVVVFYNFLAGINLTAEKLEIAGICYEIMTGATHDRQRVVKRFQEDDDCKVLLMTVKTGGVGLNLVAADTVFIVEPWWNKAAEDQAINRLHRIGQKNAVNCYYLITADTIEEKIRLLQEKKSALVDAVISSDTSGGKNLSDDDIKYLLSK